MGTDRFHTQAGKQRTGEKLLTLKKKMPSHIIERKCFLFPLYKREAPQKAQKNKKRFSLTCFD